MFQQGFHALKVGVSEFQPLGDDGERIGSDHLLYQEEPPAPGGPATIGYSSMSWWEYPQLLLDFPIYLVIGVKELAGEIIKSGIDVAVAGSAFFKAADRNAFVKKLKSF